MGTRKRSRKRFKARKIKGFPLIESAYHNSPNEVIALLQTFNLKLEDYIGKVNNKHD